MTSQQVDLLQQSFRLIKPVMDDAAIVFYERLFEIDPSLQRLFHRSAREQARLLAETLTAVVSEIDRPAQLRRVIEALGPRYAATGVRDENYLAVGEALLWTLENALKDAFTSDVRDAWMTAYSWLAFRVQRATARCRPDAPVGEPTHTDLPPRPCSERS
jgi:hemoglobin-like flavoprotein